MAKKAAKQPPHLRLRIDPKLVTRLEKAREANGNTLTGEIVGRLESSFSTEDRVALVRESLAKRIEDMRGSIRETRDQLERDHQEFIAEAREVQAQASKDNRELQKELEHVKEGLKREIAVVDTLLGEDRAAREAIRAIALLFANNPGWAASEIGVHEIAQDVAFIVKTVAKQGEAQ
jgi:hypothetical protein